MVPEKQHKIGLLLRDVAQSISTKTQNDQKVSENSVKY